MTILDVDIPDDNFLYTCIHEFALQTSHSDANDFTSTFLGTVDDGVKAHALAVLLSALAQDYAPGAVELTEETPSGDHVDLEARLFTLPWPLHRKTTYYIRVKDTVLSLVLPLASLLVSLGLTSSNSHGSLGQASAIAKSILSNVVALQDTKDHAALRVLEAIAQLRAIGLWEMNHNLGGTVFPSTEALLIYLQPEFTEHEIVSALQRLTILRLITCEHWGNDEGDISNLRNQWSERP